MSWFQKFLEKHYHGFYHTVDIKTLEEYLYIEQEDAIRENFDIGVDLYIYYKGEKHEIKMCNYSASTNLRDQEKGFVIYYDEVEFTSISDLLENAVIANTKLKDMSGYFQIEVMEWEHVFLINYTRTHPGLRITDYE